MSGPGPSPCGTPLPISASLGPVLRSFEEGQPSALWGAFGVAGLVLFSDGSLGPSGWTGCQHSWVGDVGRVLLSASLRQESEDGENS